MIAVKKDIDSLLGSVIEDSGAVYQITEELDKLYSKHIGPNEEEKAYYIPDPSKFANWIDVHFKKSGFEFPPHTRDLINVNMMPFELFNHVKTLPVELQPYFDLISKIPIFPNDKYRVAYLSIHESPMIPGGPSQRRPGLHIDQSLLVDKSQSRVMHMSREKFSAPKSSYSPEEYDDKQMVRSICWGQGYYDWDRGVPVGGIWLASNIAGTTAVYPLTIDDPIGVVDSHGGIEHMRDVIEKKYEKRLLGANELCWITDRTPHESLPLPLAQYPSQHTEQVYIRQFLRVVVGRVDVWYSKHSTPNPLVEPDCPISDADKFYLRSI